MIVSDGIVLAVPGVLVAFGCFLTVIDSARPYETATVSFAINFAALAFMSYGWVKCPRLRGLIRLMVLIGVLQLAVSIEVIL